LRLSRLPILILCLAPLLIFAISSFNVNAVPVLQIKLSVNRANSSLAFLGNQTFNVGEGIVISSNITLDGNATANLAAIAINSPSGNPYVIRTVETGNVSKMYFRVQILDLYTCDQAGNRRTLFGPGDSVYVNVTVKNIDVVYRQVIIGLYAQSPVNTPLYAYYPSGDNMTPGLVAQHLVSFPTLNDVHAGQGTVFVSLFTDYPANDGYAYCPEGAANFSISTSSPAMPAQPQYNNMTFSLPNKGAQLGNYSVHAATNFNVYQTATDTKQIIAVLLGDINKDNVVNMKDIAIAISLFQSTPSSGNWNPNADVNKDLIVNMRDIALLIAFFGNTGTP
jgi:hypothetical protein